MFKLGDIVFGDTVRIVEADPTRESGHANLIGICYGVTTPSVPAVDVIGDPTRDVALSVSSARRPLDVKPTRGSRRPRWPPIAPGCHGERSVPNSA
jgi:hypothetical protein